MDIPVSDDTQKSVEELLGMLQKENQGKDKDCNLCSRMFKTLFLLLEENEKLTDYADKVSVHSKKTEMWGREIRESMQINRDEIMNEMYIFRDELRYVNTEPEKPLPRVNRRRYDNGKYVSQ
tara:strand:+ start:688 stop:1053 length:366 start_codon:yes stop_codon:yes gene_type:complete